MKSIVYSSPSPVNRTYAFVKNISTQSMSNLFHSWDIILFSPRGHAVGSYCMERKVEWFFRSKVIRKVNELRCVAAEAGPLIAIAQFQIAESFNTTECRVDDRHKLKGLIVIR